MKVPSPYIQLTQCGFLDTYLSDSHESDLKIIDSFIARIGGSVLLIRSEMGNGGTHLLSGIANRLIDQGQQLDCLSCEGLVRIYHGDQIEFELYLSSYNYWLVDQIDYFIGSQTFSIGTRHL